MPEPQVWAVIVAAGWGERFGGPKQFSDLGGARLVDHAVATASEACDAVVLVVPDAREWEGAEVAPSRAQCSLPCAASEQVRPKARSATRSRCAATCAERSESRCGTPSAVATRWPER